jgi:hypothetical protein
MRRRARRRLKGFRKRDSGHNNLIQTFVLSSSSKRKAAPIKKKQLPRKDQSIRKIPVKKAPMAKQKMTPTMNPRVQRKRGGGDAGDDAEDDCVPYSGDEDELYSMDDTTIYR